MSVWQSWTKGLHMGENGETLKSMNEWGNCVFLLLNVFQLMVIISDKLKGKFLLQYEALI